MLRLMMFIVLVTITFPLFAQDRAIKSSNILSNIENADMFSTSAAFVAGVYDYDNGWADLPGVKSDLDAVADELALEGFDVVKKTNLTKISYKSELENFLHKYRNNKKARLIIYYAGHGHTLNTGNEKTGYIVLKDADVPSKDVSGFKRGSIPMTYFSERAKSIKSSYVLFVFDSCFSGTVFSSMRSVPEILVEVLKKPVRQFISSGAENQMVPDFSIFRQRFIDGVKGNADSNRDSVVTGSELGAYLKESVSAYSAGTQTPMYGKLTGYEGEFVFINKNTAPKENSANDNITEKEQLIAKLKANPYSPDSEATMARLREIDESLSNMPPVDAPERKNFTMSAKSTVIKTTAPTSYPYIVIAPVAVQAKDRLYKAALRIKAKDDASFKKLSERKYMLKSVLNRRLKESSLRNFDDIIQIRENIKSTSESAVNWVCPGCITEQPAIAGLMGL